MPDILKGRYSIGAIDGLMTNMYACWKRKIQNVSIFATNRCNSRCKICYIWNETPKFDLEKDIIENLLKSRFLSKSCFIGLVGGEFLLHPQYEEIIKTVKKKTKNYVLYSNCILSDRVIETVKKFRIPNIQISLDGTRETYEKVRGVDKYDNVIKVIENLKDKTRIGVIYTINPLNTKKDFIHVINIVKDNNVNISVGIYDRREMFHTELSKNNNYDISDIFRSNFLNSYKLWANKNLNLPCLSIRSNLTVLPNGDVPLCQNKSAALGNLYNEKIDDVWKRMMSIQDENKNCNGCWLPCQRGFDNLACKFLSTLFPETVLNKFIGKYDWKKAGGL